MNIVWWNCIGIDGREHWTCIVCTLTCVYHCMSSCVSSTCCCSCELCCCIVISSRCCATDNYISQFLVRLYMARKLSLAVLFQILFLMLLICVAYVSHFSLVLVLMMSDQLIKYQSSDMMSHIVYSNHNLYHCSSVEWEILYYFIFLYVMFIVIYIAGMKHQLPYSHLKYAVSVAFQLASLLQ